MADRTVITYRYRLLPTKAQHRSLGCALQHTADLMNAALQERIDAYRKAGIRRSYVDQQNGLTQLRRDLEYTNYSVTMQRWPLKQVDLAMRSFFRRLRAGQKPGFPRFKSADRVRAFGFYGVTGWRVQGRYLTMKGIGSVRFSQHRDLPSAPLSCVVRRHGARWYVCLSVEVAVAAKHQGPTVGLDMGIAHLATLSTGEHIENRREGGKRRAAIKRSHQALARCSRGSKRRQKVRAQLARATEREANARRTYLHQVSADLTRRFGCIVLEDLRVVNMMRSAKGTALNPGTNVKSKSGLNRELADASFGKFRELLTYKAERAGGKVVAVDPRHTSQTCAACGVINAAGRKQQRFDCVSCGHSDHADVNAALNILARGTGVLVRDQHNVGDCSKRAGGSLVYRTEKAPN